MANLNQSINGFNTSFFEKANNMSFLANGKSKKKTKESKIIDPENSKFMDEENSAIWEKAIEQNNIIMRNISKRGVPLITQNREYEEMVNNFLTANTGTSENELKKEFLFQLQSKINETQIQAEMSAIYDEIFFKPSVSLTNSLGPNYNEILYKTIVMKLPDLFNTKSSNDNVEREKNYIVENIYGWGQLFVDFGKLESYVKKKFAQKEGDSLEKNYDLPFYDLEISLINRNVSVKYKGRNVTPTEFQTNILRSMATERLLDKAKNLIELFSKYTEAKFKEGLQKMTKKDKVNSELKNLVKNAGQWDITEDF